MHVYRTHNCAALRAADAGQTVKLSGWVHRKRDHGGVLFIDLRDHHGLTQIVAGPSSPAFPVLDRIRVESVVTIIGDVVLREGGAINSRLPTGEVEVRAKDITIQSTADELPMPVAGEAEYPEDIRLKYRCLDLRRMNRPLAFIPQRSHAPCCRQVTLGILEIAIRPVDRPQSIGATGDQDAHLRRVPGIGLVIFAFALCIGIGQHAVFRMQPANDRGACAG